MVVLCLSTFWQQDLLSSISHVDKNVHEIPMPLLQSLSDDIAGVYHYTRQNPSHTVAKYVIGLANIFYVLYDTGILLKLNILNIWSVCVYTNWM